jgi:hypothetical protein
MTLQGEADQDFGEVGRSKEIHGSPGLFQGGVGQVDREFSEVYIRCHSVHYFQRVSATGADRQLTFL